jgi:hypothetical protein
MASEAQEIQGYQFRIPGKLLSYQSGMGKTAILPNPDMLCLVTICSRCKLIYQG